VSTHRAAAGNGSDVYAYATSAATTFTTSARKISTVGQYLTIESDGLSDNPNQTSTVPATASG
jgi:hypothetical protein